MTACGNAVGNASAACTASTGTTGTGTGTTGTGTTGTGTTGNPTDPGTTIGVPVTVCGNAIGLLGGSSSSCGITTPSTGTPVTPIDPIVPITSVIPTVPGGGSGVGVDSVTASSLAFTGSSDVQLAGIALALLLGDWACA